MEVKPVCFILTLLLCLLHAAASIRGRADGTDAQGCAPAAIVRLREREIYFEEGEKIFLPCIAKGDAPLEYAWLKNGEELNVNSSENAPRMEINYAGILNISPAQLADAGTYQCRVRNACGTSLSWKYLVKHAYLRQSSPQHNKPVNVKGELGKGLRLSCTPPTCDPAPKIVWWLTRAGFWDDVNKTEEPERVSLGERVTVDPFGNLYFVALDEKDAAGGKVYTCSFTNDHIRTRQLGNNYTIEITGDAQQDSPTELAWHSDTHTLALETEEASLKCIFFGHPVPQVQWRRLDFWIDKGRMKIVDAMEFVIKEVDLRDAGQYECSAVNQTTNTSISHTFTLEVQASPMWIDRPDDVTAREGENVTFECTAHAVPNVTTQWYINGVPIEEAPPAENRRLQEHGHVLELTNVSLQDSQVLQCNLSNIHGYLWQDMFLRVKAPLDRDATSFDDSERYGREGSSTGDTFGVRHSRGTAATTGLQAAVAVVLVALSTAAVC